MWNPEAIVGDRRIRKVAHGEQGRGVCAVADVAQNVIGRVIRLDPLEAVLVEILAPQCWGIAVDEVNIPHEALDALVPFATPTVEVAPVHGMPLGPLGSLAKFLAHEEQVLAGVGEHVAIEGAEAGGLIPVVARHAFPQRALAVDYFVVAKRQYVALGVGIDHGEGELAMVIGTVNGLVLEVLQGVIHPAHIPFQGKA